MAVYGPVCHQNNIIWTEASICYIYSPLPGIDDNRRIWLSYLSPLCLLLPETFKLFGFILRVPTWWRLSQKCVVRTIFDSLQVHVTLADFGYPFKALWVYCFQIFLYCWYYFVFQYFILSVLYDGYFIKVSWELN
jgi:hypothetical protein